MFALRGLTKSFFKNTLYIQQKKISLVNNLPSRQFSSQNKLYGCQKARDNYEELVLTIKKNIDIIEKSYRGKEHNYLQNSLNNLINIGLSDHLIVAEIIKEMNDNKLHKQITESSQVERLFLDLIKLVENPKYQNVGVQMMEDMTQNFIFLKYKQLQNIEQNISESSNKYVKNLLQISPKIKESIKKYQNISNQDLQNEICIKNNIKQTSKNYKIVSFDTDQSQFVLFDEKSKQEIIIQGIDNDPKESYEPLKRVFKEKKGTINLLIVQDQPIVDYDSQDPEQMNNTNVDQANQMQNVQIIN